jgi:hypothetical protein
MTTAMILTMTTTMPTPGRRNQTGWCLSICALVTTNNWGLKYVNWKGTEQPIIVADGVDNAGAPPGLLVVVVVDDDDDV